ncbi:MAG: hypothetical protein Q6364_14050 [Candidatus Hermodarchaeota archaeon]|nr:hypothetical protein [Candidatus Hermodarchaeota archaeon]
MGNAFGDEIGFPGIQLMGHATDGECKGAFDGSRGPQLTCWNQYQRRVWKNG